MSSKNIWAILCMVSLGCASLLETTDQKMLNNTALAGNPAAIAVTKKQGIILNSSVKRDTTLSSSFFSGMQSSLENRDWESWLYYDDNTGKDTFKGSGANTTPVHPYQYLAYVGSLDNNKWFAIQYQKQYEAPLAYKIANTKFEDGTGEAFKEDKMYYSYRKEKSLENWKLSYGTNIMNDLTMGISVATNRDVETEKWSFNKEHKQYIGYEKNGYSAFKISDPYYSLSVGVIKKLNDTHSLTLAQSFYENKRSYHTEKTAFDDNDHRDIYRENKPQPNITSLGYIVKPIKNLELALTMQSVWGLNYNQDIVSYWGYDADGKGYNLMHVKERPYNVYGVACEYGVLDNLVIQSSFSRAKGVGRKDFDTVNESYLYHPELNQGKDIDTITLDLLYKFNKHNTLTLGASKENIMAYSAYKVWPLVGDAVYHNKQYKIEDTRVYLGYMYNF